MASPLTLKPKAGSEDSNSSRGTGSGSSGHKRKSPRDHSVSGYSADREDSSSSPPINSIDLDGNETRQGETMREMNACPKRYKRSELQFAASSVTADLARAGIERSSVDPEIKATSKLGSISISLRGVRLVKSKEYQRNPVVNQFAPTGSCQDYQALAFACFDMYPNLVTKAENISSSSQDSDQSTSSVSESDSESVTSKSNLEDDAPATFIIPPLSREAPGNNCKELSNPSNSCALLSMGRNAMTMSETMTLTNVPRLVAMSYNPFSIVHANAAFFRLSGLPSEKIIGSGFATIIDSQATEEASKPVRLSDCMASSHSGHHQKLQIIQNSEDSSREPVERYFKVLPVVSKKPLNGKQVSYVTHLAVDLLGESDGAVLSMSQPSDANMAVGVMG